MARISKAAERRKRRQKEREAVSPPVASPPENSPPPPPQSNTPEMMQTAIGHHMAGRFQEAESIYHQALAQHPDLPDAIHLLGVIRHQTGNHEEAVEYISKAISLNDAQSVYHSSLGAALLSMGKNDEAIERFTRAIALDPNNADAHLNIARGFRIQGRNAEAASSFRKLIGLKPDLGDACRELGHVLLALGESASAAEAFREAVRLNPADYDSLYQLGSKANILEAEKLVREALALRPDDLNAQLFLGASLFEQGAYDEAGNWFRKVLETKPDFAEALFGLGLICWVRKDLEGSVEFLRRSLLAKSDFQDVYYYLAAVYSELGMIDEERGVYRDALARWPDNTVLRLLVDTYFPPICMSSDEMDERRRTMRDALERYDPAQLKIWPKILPVFWRPHFFHMGFSGRDDLGLKSTYMDLLARSFKENFPHFYAGSSVVPSRNGELPHIGFVATVTNSLLLWLKGVIRHMTPGRFRVSIVCTAMNRAEIAENFEDFEGLEYLVIDHNFEHAVNEIREANFDLLFYHEIGTEPLNSILPFFRLAPVQCTSFYGLGSTSANPEVDYYLSSDLVEPEGGEKHYREELVRLRSLGFYLEWPKRPELMKDRSHFGFDVSEHIYACPQALYKIHPDLDKVFGEILRRDPAGVLVLLESRHPEWNEILMRRLHAAFPDEAVRVRMLPRQENKDFLNLIAVSDVLLDSIHTSGGTSAFETLAMGTPIVTWPSEFARGRTTHAFYDKMGVLDCTASSLDEYVEIAVRLGCDVAYREEIRNKILAANHLIYEDVESVHELEDFFQLAVDKVRT